MLAQKGFCDSVSSRWLWLVVAFLVSEITCSPVSGQIQWVAQVRLTLPDPLQDVLQIADDRFQIRQQARQNLVDLGIDAWDWLYMAQGSSNQEIASSATRILENIDFEADLAGHVPLLANFRSLDFSGRARMIIYLGRRGGANEIRALALITRYESDELLSRSAAIELIMSGNGDVSFIPEIVRTSPRTASQWLCIYAKSVAHPEQFQRLWQPAIRSLRNDHYAAHQPNATRRLLQWYGERLDAVGDSAQGKSTAVEIVNLVEGVSTDVIEVFDWLLLFRHYEGCDQLVQRFDELMTTDPRLIYRRAELARRRGNPEEAKKIAANTEGVNPKDHFLGIQFAVNLQLAGLDYWAACELDRIIEDESAKPSLCIQACSLKAEILYRQQDFDAAVRTLELALKQKRDHGDGVVAVLTESTSALSARQDYFRHLDAVEQADWRLARLYLLNGLEAAPDNSDLLIAMSRFSGGDDEPAAIEAWRNTTRELIGLALQNRMDNIKHLRATTERDARQGRLRQEALTRELNAYAWLASQTGTNLPMAESMAEEAVELSPASSYVLDTLAACQFSRGKYSEAVVTQQRALRRDPWSSELRADFKRYQQVRMLAELPGFFR